VDSKLFAQAVDRVATISAEKSRSVRMAVDSGKCVLTVRNMEAGQAVEELELDYDGDPFELSFNAKRWDETLTTSEFRPIVGWHFDRVDLIVNPILDTAYDGIKNLVFAPSMRFAYKVNDATQLALEEYAEYGPVKEFAPAGQQSHQLFGVLNRTIGKVDIETGIGFGLTGASDDVTMKFMVAYDFNKPRAVTK